MEQERGLKFLRSVEVDFLDPAEFEAEVTAAPDDLTEADQAELAAMEAQGRALGIFGPDTAVLAELNQAQSDGVIGLYDPETERITVKGDEVGPLGRAVLVHELTHALQDQHFDLERLGDLGDEASTLAFRALIEGDASRVESAWVAALDADEQLAHAEATQRLVEGSESLGDATVSAVEIILSAPYALGEPFAVLLRAAGQARLDDAFRSPPVAEAVLLDATFQLEGRPRDDPPPPSLAADEEPIVIDGEADEGEFGALYLTLVLASRLPAQQALSAADGWAGDRYVGYTAGARQCIRSSFRMVDAAEGSQLFAALEQWRAAGPADTASVSVSDDRRDVMLDSCDPGAAAAAPTRLVQGFLLAIARATLESQIAANGTELEIARCVARTAIELIDPALVERFEEIGGGAELPRELRAGINEATGEAGRTCLRR